MLHLTSYVWCRYEYYFQPPSTRHRSSSVECESWMCSNTFLLAGFRVRKLQLGGTLEFQDSVQLHLRAKPRMTIVLLALRLDRGGVCSVQVNIVLMAVCAGVASTSRSIILFVLPRLHQAYPRAAHSTQKKMTSLLVFKIGYWHLITIEVTQTFISFTFIIIHLQT